MTKREGEPYEELIERAGANDLGRYVKIVDNAWNIATNPTLSLIDPERAHRMLHVKYLPARMRLQAACGGIEFDDLASESLDTIFARFGQFLPPRRAWAGVLKLDVEQLGHDGALRVSGVDETAPYGAMQHNVYLRLPASELATLRYALDAHPLVDIVQLVIRHADQMFTGVFTEWLTEHAIDFDFSESWIER